MQCIQEIQLAQALAEPVEQEALVHIYALLQDGLEEECIVLHGIENALLRECRAVSSSARSKSHEAVAMHCAMLSCLLQLWLQRD